MICVTSDNYIHLLEIADMELEIAKSIHMEGRLKSVTAVCVESSRKKALIGTEGGNIYSLSLQNLTIGQGDQEIIYQDKVITEVPDNFKVCPGSVEAILEYETDANKILIGRVSSQRFFVIYYRVDGSAFFAFSLVATKSG